MRIIFNDGSTMDVVSMYPTNMSITNGACMIAVDVYGGEYTISVNEIQEILSI